MSSRYLTFDFGASSGRAMLVTYDSGKIAMEEIHRFTNDPVSVRGTLYWDILRLFFEIKAGITKAVHAGGFDYIGIDTWGIDFGLIGKDGQLLQNPVHYRDARTDNWEELFDVIPRDELYAHTGIQMIQINTIFQLFALKKNNPELIDMADCMMFVPDILAYFLTGTKSTEYTIASTSQLLDANARDWDFEIIGKLGLPKKLFLPINMPGGFYGTISEDIQEELGCGPAKVVRTPVHDTASAVLATPTQNKDFVYISCGTWSLLGTETDEPVITELGKKYNFANEGGVGGKIRLLKNIMGLWILQESRRQWAREGNSYSFTDLEKLAMEAEPFKCFINPDDPLFIKAGNMPRRIREYCKKTGQQEPQTVGEIVRCIDESLALRYRQCIDETEECTGKKFPDVNLLGGGTQSKLLCSMTANAGNRRVVAGPVEATALGNVAMQLIASGQIKDTSEARAAVERSSEVFYYEPEHTPDWDEAYARYLKLF